MQFEDAIVPDYSANFG